MKKYEAIDILENCVKVLELAETRVQEIEDEGVLDCPESRSVLRGTADHVHVAIDRIRCALKWQYSYDEISHK